MRLVMPTLIMLSLDMPRRMQATNMKWAARKCHLVRKHDAWVFWLSPHPVQDWKSYCGPDASCWALSPSALKCESELVLCEIRSWSPESIYPTLVGIQHLVNIFSKTRCWNLSMRKNEAFHSKCVRPAASLLVSRSWTCVQRCKVTLWSVSSGQDILNAVCASVIPQYPVVCKWVALLVFLSIDSYIYSVNDTWS